MNTFSSLVLTARQLKGDGSTRRLAYAGPRSAHRQGVSRNKARLAEAGRGLIPIGNVAHSRVTGLETTNWSTFCASIEHRKGTDTKTLSKYLDSRERPGPG